MIDYTKRLLGSAAMLIAAGTLAQAQVVEIPASFAYPTNLIDTTAPGFVVRVVQADKTAGELPNSTARTEAQLAGVLANELTGVLYTNVANLNQLMDDGVTPKFNPDGTYFETAVIDYHSGTFPGIPGLSDPLADITDPASFNNGDSFAVEALTYLVLEPGLYSMVVNSDDGFQVKVGPDARDQATSIVLGTYEGGRGASDTVFQFHVSQLGAYSFRLIYEEGGGGYDLNWSTADTNDATIKTAVNAEGGILAYRKISGGSPLVIDLLAPGADAVGISPAAIVNARIVDGSTAKLDTNSVKLYFDNVLVSASISKAAAGTTVSYDPPGLLKGLTKHTVGLVFADNTSPANVRSNSYSFTIANFGNIVLPAPIYYEDFESLTEGSLPAGWTVENYSTPGIEDTSPDDPLDIPGSTLYDNWVLITKDRVLAIGAAGRWSGGDRVRFPAQFVNGQPIDGIVSNKFMYAESDTRGGSQVQYMFTKDYDLTGKTNLFVSYFSMYEQNQDSFGSTEYSIDGGTTWLPIVYMIDTVDIVNDVDGKPDAYATFTKVNSDTAADPLNPDGDRTYGAFVGAASNTWVNLGPYISGRVNDDSVESKRVELFPIPQADNQKTVRFRFAQGGTGSWYFGIDNLGVYSITTPILVAPKITTVSSGVVGTPGQSVELSVAATGTAPLTYQWTYNGVDIAGANGTNLVFASLNSTNAGKYTVVIRNDAGVASSSDINVTVVSADVDLKTDLVVHLAFNGDYTDNSGRGNNATAKGTPDFQAGKFGQALHIKSTADGLTANYASLGYPADLKFGDATDFTVSMWVQYSSQTDDHPFISNKNWDSSGNKGWGVFSQSGSNFRVNITGTGGTKFESKPTIQLKDGQWHNVVVSVKRTGNVVSYVDGAQVGSVAMATTGTIDTDDLVGYAVNIGQDGRGTYTDGGSSSLEGLVDDVGIWRRALTADEVGGIYLKAASGYDITTDAVTVGLVGHYTFDGDYKDSSGRTNDATAAGTPDFQEGKFGQALHIKSTTDGSIASYATLGYPSDLKFGDSADFSIAMWVKYSSQTDDHPFISNKNWDSSGNKGWGVFSQSGSNFRVNITGTGGTKFESKPTIQLKDGQWHNVVVSVKRTGNVVSYVDGTPLASVAMATTGTIDTDDLEGYAVNIGQDGRGTYTDGGSSSLEGLVDDVGIWRRALTEQDVATIYLRSTKGKNLAGVGAEIPVTLPINITSISKTATSVNLVWTGGDGPFLIEGKTDIGAATWTKLLTTADRTASIPLVGSAMFLRIQDKTTDTVKLFRAEMNGANEVPAITTPGTGRGLLAVNGTEGFYLISYENLRGSAILSHIHGPAPVTASAGVLIGLNTPSGTSGSITGTITVTAGNLTTIEAGNTYFNIHCAAPGAGGGEIRGQLVK